MHAKFFFGNWKCRMLLEIYCCIFVSVPWVVWDQSWHDQTVCSFKCTFEKHADFFLEELAKLWENIYVYKILFVRRSTWIPTSLLVKISTRDTQRVQSGLPGKKGGLRDWKCHRLIKYISSYMRLTFFAAAFLMTSGFKVVAPEWFFAQRTNERCLVSGNFLNWPTGYPSSPQFAVKRQDRIGGLPYLRCSKRHGLKFPPLSQVYKTLIMKILCKW